MTVTGFGFTIGGIYMTLLLLSGCLLSFITIRRMIRGQIALPGWTKWLLSAAMIGMLLITLIGMLPPLEVKVDNPFTETHTHIVHSADPSEPTDCSERIH